MTKATMYLDADTQDDTTASPELFFSPVNLAYVKKSVQELRNGKGTEHELVEVEEP